MPWRSDASSFSHAPKSTLKNANEVKSLCLRKMWNQVSFKSLYKPKPSLQSQSAVKQNGNLKMILSPHQCVLLTRYDFGPKTHQTLHVQTSFAASLLYKNTQKRWYPGYRKHLTDCHFRMRMISLMRQGSAFNFPPLWTGDERLVKLHPKIRFPVKMPSFHFRRPKIRLFLGAFLVSLHSGFLSALGPSPISRSKTCCAGPGRLLYATEIW